MRKGEITMKEENMIKVYNLSGKFMYQSHQETAEEAYKEYVKIIENMKKELPKGYGATITRERNGKIMTMETVIGNK